MSDFKDKIKLSIFTLDKNAIDHVDLYEQVMKEWVTAISERDAIKDTIPIIKAEAELDVRTYPERYGWKNESKPPTEAWYSMKVLLHEKVRDNIKNLTIAQHKVNEALAAKEILETRGKRLDNLIDLYKGQYFVAKARKGENYSESLTKKNEESQTDSLKESPRMKERVTPIKKRQS